MFGIFISMLLFTDMDSPSVYGSICWFALMIAMWPVALCAYILHGDPPPILFLLLFVVSGLFWAWIVDFYFVLRR